MMITLISHYITFSIISFYKKFCHTNKFNARDITWGQLDATLVRCERALPWPTVCLRAPAAPPPARRDTRFQLVATRWRRLGPRARAATVKTPSAGGPCRLSRLPPRPRLLSPAQLQLSHLHTTPLPPRTSAASRVDAGRVTSAESAPPKDTAGQTREESIAGDDR